MIINPFVLILGILYENAKYTLNVTNLSEIASHLGTMTS